MDKDEKYNFRPGLVNGDLTSIVEWNGTFSYKGIVRLRAIRYGLKRTIFASDEVGLLQMESESDAGGEDTRPLRE